VKTLKISLIASAIGSAAGLGAWAFGFGEKMWPGHPQMACFLLTLCTTIVIQIAWPRLVGGQGNPN
jgi:hypothetical protein